MILALDLGSTSFKTAVFDSALRTVGTGSQAVGYRYGSAGEVELEVEEAASAARKAIRQAIRSSGVRSGNLRAVALTSQAQTFTILDARGHPRIPFISWQDARAAQACRTLARSPAMAQFHRHASFGALLPALQICQLKHIGASLPHQLDRHDQVLMLPAFLVRQWTGTAVLDDNLAAMSGLASLVTRAWWPPALRTCKLHPSQLPRLIPVGTTAARTTANASAFGLPGGLPVVLAGNDQTAGAHAAELRERGGLLLTLGTAQVAYAFSSRLARPHPDLIRGPFPGGGFYRMAADAWGGNLVHWARTVVAGSGTDDALFALAAQATPGCQGLAVEPGPVPGTLTHLRQFENLAC